MSGGASASGGQALLGVERVVRRNRDFQNPVIDQNDVAVAAEVLHLGLFEEGADDLRLHIEPKDGALGLNHRVKLVALPLGPVHEGRVDQSPALDVADLDHERPTGIVELAVPLENLVQSVFEIARRGSSFARWIAVSLGVPASPCPADAACEPALSAGRTKGIVTAVTTAAVLSRAATSMIRVMNRVLKVAWVSAATEGDDRRPKPCGPPGAHRVLNRGIRPARPARPPWPLRAREAATSSPADSTCPRSAQPSAQPLAAASQTREDRPLSTAEPLGRGRGR